MRRPLSLSVVVLALCTVSACGNSVRTVVGVKSARQVDIEVEVFDPRNNLVWQGVAVRLVEGFHEWSGSTVQNIDPDPWLFTDQSGRVLFTSGIIGDADIGFQEDDFGRAVIQPDVDEDEAFVLIEIDALGFSPVQVDIPISWRAANVLVRVPFPSRT